MPAEILSLLVQIPIVVAFIWYTQMMTKQFMDFLKEQREAERSAIDQRRDADREIQRDMIGAIEKVEESLNKHDANMTAQIRSLDDRRAKRDE
jgi:signal transduction histidine kinase